LSYWPGKTIDSALLPNVAIASSRGRGRSRVGAPRLGSSLFTRTRAQSVAICRTCGSERRLGRPEEPAGGPLAGDGSSRSGYALRRGRGADARGARGFHAGC